MASTVVCPLVPLGEIKAPYITFALILPETEKLIPVLLVWKEKPEPDGLVLCEDVFDVANGLALPSGYVDSRGFYAGDFIIKIGFKGAALDTAAVVLTLGRPICPGGIGVRPGYGDLLSRIPICKIIEPTAAAGIAVGFAGIEKLC